LVIDDRVPDVSARFAGLSFPSWELVVGAVVLTANLELEMSPFSGMGADLLDD
jgi:hypothetical protein